VRQSLSKQKEPIQVLVVTADNITSELLKNVFAHKRRDFAVETLTGSSQVVLGELGAYKPHVAVISEELQDGPQAGVKVLQKLWHSQHTPTIMLLQGSNPESVVKAFRGGARGIFYRTQSLKSLTKCIQTVHRGQIWARNEDVEHVLTALIHTIPHQFNNATGMPLLTRREEDVVRLAIEGLKNREIAQILKLKEHSIRNYLYQIFEKLGVSTRVELILYAFSQRDSSN
jgi:DNA-binding NarL/FixJ family response regulator